MIPLLQSKGIAVVVEIDDDIEHIPPENPAWKDYHPVLGGGVESKVRVMEASRIADGVTVGTPTLQGIYGGTVLRNCIPERVLDISTTPIHTFGWAGAGEFHRGDFKPCGGAVAQAVRSAGGGFSIGARNASEVASWLGLSDGQWEKSHYWDVPCGEHYKTLDYRIGIVPLAPNLFNQSKSWLKGLENAALGIPTVASWTAAYEEWALEEKSGVLLAQAPKEWKRHLTRLTLDSGLYEDCVEYGRAAAARWTFEARAEDWVEAWEAARIARHHAVAA